jgi:hypothetical protein
MESTHYLFTRTARVYRPGGDVRVEVHVSIDLDDLAARLGGRANANVSGKTALMQGIIRASLGRIVTPEEDRP